MKYKQLLYTNYTLNFSKFLSLERLILWKANWKFNKLGFLFDFQFISFYLFLKKCIRQGSI
jgi:hypothetical protein